MSTSFRPTPFTCQDCSTFQPRPKKADDLTDGKKNFIIVLLNNSNL